MRTVLVTGPGGAGRTTVAAATALAAADRGDRTLLLSAEAIPGFPAATGPTPVTDRLDHVRIDSGEHFRAELTELQSRASGVLDLLGAGRLDGEELTELPGSPSSPCCTRCAAPPRATCPGTTPSSSTSRR